MTPIKNLPKSTIGIIKILLGKFSDGLIFSLCGICGCSYWLIGAWNEIVYLAGVWINRIIMIFQFLAGISL